MRASLIVVFLTDWFFVFFLFDREIEGRVVEIARLQSYFTDQVLEQGQSLDRLHMATIGSSENIKDGNELVRDAMRKNAGFRVFILFFIITLSFTILFLDWYNP